MSKLKNMYGKKCVGSVSIELYDLNSTGSWDDREDMVCVLTVPKNIARSVRSAYRGKDISGIKDFDMIKSDATTEDGRDLYDLYFGSSYGAGRLLASVGDLLYYSSQFGADFENQY